MINILAWRYTNRNDIIPGAIYVVREHCMLEEFSAIDSRLHLFFGDEMVMLAVYFETPGRTGGVRHWKTKLVRKLIEQFPQYRRLARTRRPAHHQQPTVLSHHFRCVRCNTRYDTAVKTDSYGFWKHNYNRQSRNEYIRYIRIDTVLLGSRKWKSENLQ